MAPLGLPSRDYFLRRDRVWEEYTRLAVSVASLLGANESSVEAELNDIHEFEINLANVSETLCAELLNILNQRLSFERITNSFWEI